MVRIKVRATPSAPHFLTNHRVVQAANAAISVYRPEIAHVLRAQSVPGRSSMNVCTGCLRYFYYASSAAAAAAASVRPITTIGSGEGTIMIRNNYYLIVRFNLTNICKL